MKIREFSIRRYGPLPDTGRVQLSGFSLIYGKNDDGKTLTIDAIVRLSLKAGRVIFSNIDRVDHEPDGYLIVEYGGKEIKVPEKGYLADIAKLTPQDLRNVFIIRDSDLSIPSENEIDFYKDVTDRLTGLRSGEISRIRQSLKEMGKLTRADSSAQLADSKDFDYVGSRIKRARGLIDEIDQLEKELRREGFDELEKGIFTAKAGLNQCEQELKNLEDARKRGNYEEGSKALAALDSAIKQLTALQSYSDNDEQIWSGAETKIRTYKEDVESQLVSELDEKIKEHKDEKDKLSQKKPEFDVLKSIKAEIDRQIEPEKLLYEIKSGELASYKTMSRFSVAAVIVAILLLSISAVGIVLRPAPPFYILSAVSFIGLIVSAIFSLFPVQKKAWLAGLFARIKMRASRLNLAGETFDEIVGNIQKFNATYQKRETEIQQLSSNVMTLETQIRDLREKDLPDVRGKIREAENEIDSVKKKVDVETLQGYRERLKSKVTCEKSVAERIGILNTLFGSRGKLPEENLPFWRSEISALEQFKDIAKDVTYSEQAFTGLNGRITELRQQVEQLRGKMSDYSKQLDTIEREANEILLLEDDYIYCNTSQDLKAIQDKLEGFVHRVEETRDNTLAVMKIFEGVEQEEAEKISELFGKDSPVSRYFSEITDGIYQEVELVPDDSNRRRIRVKFGNGNVLYADQLLGGAYDQLYLSVRLALGEKLLKGDTGFFIMDDPLVKASQDRLQRQLDILRRVFRVGWQIIYFTAKNEVVDGLKHDIDTGKVSYLELQSIFPR